MHYYYIFTKVKPDKFPVFGSLSEMKEKHGDVYFRGIENKNSPSNNGYFENILLKG